MKKGKIMLKFIMSSLLLASFALSADIDIENVYVKATPQNAKASAAFMKITNNTDKEISLISGKSDVSKFTEIHEHIKEDGMMKMIRVKELKIPAKSSVELKPGGYHVMLIDLLKPLNTKEKVDLTLNFSDSKSIALKDIPVKEVKPMKHMKK